MGKTYKEVKADEALSKNHGKSVRLLKREQQTRTEERTSRDALKRMEEYKKVDGYK